MEIVSREKRAKGRERQRVPEAKLSSLPAEEIRRTNKSLGSIMKDLAKAREQCS